MNCATKNALMAQKRHPAGEKPRARNKYKHRKNSNCTGLEQQNLGVLNAERPGVVAGQRRFRQVQRDTALAVQGVRNIGATQHGHLPRKRTKSCFKVSNQNSFISFPTARLLLGPLFQPPPWCRSSGWGRLGRTNRSPEDRRH